ncbi:MAG: DNA polymerase III subunit delta [Tindallia sp. MSAO_Bac2]|nr:MAG: DNA polymerase III subunit delta [Tindallia sp. MSAO_Bac2]
MLEYDKIDKVPVAEIEPVYLITGEETLLMKRFIQRLQERLAPGGMEDFNLTRFEGKDFSIDTLLESCETLPVMCEKKLVILKNPWFLEPKGGGLESREEEKLKKYLKFPPDNTCLAIYCETKPDGRKSITKMLKKTCCVVDFQRLKEVELKKWIQAECAKRGKSISAGALIELIRNFDYLSRNPSQSLYDISGEIEKLAAFIGTKQEITDDVVRESSIYTFQNDVFELIDSLSKKKANETQVRFRKLLADGEPAMKIIAFLRNQFKTMIRVKEMEQNGYTASKIATKLKQHPFAVKKSLKYSKNFEENKLIELLNYFTQLDRKLKSGKMDAVVSMEMIIVEICS